MEQHPQDHHQSAREEGPDPSFDDDILSSSDMPEGFRGLPERPSSAPEQRRHPLREYLYRAGCFAAGLGLAATGVVGGTSEAEMSKREPRPFQPEPERLEKLGAPLSGELVGHDPITRVVARAMPAMVSIEVKRLETPLEAMGRERRTVLSLGSGFVIDRSGVIVTNNHVVEGGKEWAVTLSDGRRLPARLVGRDPESDLALLRVDAGAPLPTVPLGDSSTLEPGETVVAIGNPLGFRWSVTTGVVSATDRPASLVRLRNVLGYLQTDAAINGGNSGGALLNLEGEVVGVNDAKLTDASNIAFAIPITPAKRVIEDLLRDGKARHSSLGVAAQSLTEPVIESLRNRSDLRAVARGLVPGDGAIVVAVETGSPAERAGVKKGDVVTEIDGAKVRDDGDLRMKVANTPVGKMVRLTVVRDGRTRAMDVTTTERRATENNEALLVMLPGAVG